MRNTVKEAADAMELKLRKHDAIRGERGWAGDSPESLAVRVSEEFTEALTCLFECDYKKAAEEFVDVMNMAMMARDSCFLLRGVDVDERGK